MILIIDNYDSFTYNLFQMIGAIRPDIKAVRNDALTVEEIEKMAPEAIVLSPGPGKPADAGICEEIVSKLSGKFPILGVCLGHQAICEAFGGTVGHASRLMHGKQSETEVDASSPIFADLPAKIKVARYHSLSLKEGTLPSCLKVTARADDGEIMAVQHKEYPVYGLQFHPESIMTPDGKKMLQNFIDSLG
ncbi:MAG: aminodeoxychorismate/anthranilate synthase component II [Butyrivibrio sp.]|nr:aminodeoxychorismate/anthranilate synthase component II [Butyrivibrio sp.]